MMKTPSAGCESSLEDSHHTPPPSESVSTKPTGSAPASIPDGETSGRVAALEDKLKELLPLIESQQATIQSLEAIACAQKETLGELRNTVEEHRRRIQSLEAPPPSQSLMDATNAALSAARDSTLEFLPHLVAFFAHRREIDVVYSNVDGALAKLEQLLLPTAPFALQGENEYNPEAQQQSIGGVDAVQTMDELYKAADIIQPIYNQFLDDIAAGVEGTTVNRAPGLKERERATEKATDSYNGYQPGPPVSWLFDIVRGSLVCQNADAVVEVAKAVAADTRVKVLTKFKNRFHTPTPAGFRDVMLVVRLETTDPSGLRVSHNCELQIHLEPVLKFSKENNSHHHYEYFRTYFIGSSETVAARMKDLKAVVGNTAGLLYSQSNKMAEELENVSPKTSATSPKAPKSGNSAKKRARPSKKAPGDATPQKGNQLTLGSFFKQKKAPLSASSVKSKPASPTDFLGRVLRDVMNSGDTERFNALYKLLSDRFNEYDLAMCILKQQAEVEKARYGVKHKDVATTYHHMGSVLDDQGKYDKSMAMFKKSLDIMLQVLPPDHTDIADSYNSMGLVLKRQGKYDEALAKYEQCLKIQLEALGPKHEDVARSYNNMAGVLKRQGKYEEAMENYEESLKINLKTLGPKHEDVGKSYNNMANVLQNQGKYKEAIEKYEKALEIALKTLGRDHTKVGDTRYNMALLLAKQGDLSAAAEHLRECVRIYTNAYEEDHEKVVKAKGLLALVEGHLRTE